MPEKSAKPSMGRQFSTVALLTILSKVFGMARDMVVASTYGATPLADAYNYATMFTGNILILFGGLGGPFHSATVVILKPKKDDPESGKLITQIMIATGLILFVIASLIFIFAPVLISLQAQDYGKADVVNGALNRAVLFREAILQLRWMSPLVVLSGLIGVTYGVLNVFNRVFWPSMSPSIASVAIIIALFLFPSDPHLPLLERTSVPLAIGSLIGAFGQLFAQLPDMFKCGLKYKFDFKLSPELHQFIDVLWPAFIGTSIGQLTLYIDGYFTSSCEVGGWTAVMNGNRLVQLPLGVLITAILVPILPRFTEHADANKPDDVKREFSRAFRFMSFIAFPLTMCLLVLAKPIIRCLFERNQWTAQATDLVAVVILYLAPSIVIYIGRDMITRVFYAYKDSKTPYYVGMIAIVVKALLDFLLVYQLKMGVAGIALATSLITVINFTLLSTLLRRKIGPLGFTSLVVPMLIMTFATVLAGVATYFIFHFLVPILSLGNGAHGLVHSLKLLLGIGIASGIGMAVYTGATIACRLEEPTMLAQRFKLLPKKTE